MTKTKKPKMFGVKPIKSPKTSVKPLAAKPKKIKKAPSWMSPPSVRNNPAAENSGPIPTNALSMPKMMPKKK